jgi:PAS domain S-box-containing protein
MSQEIVTLTTASKTGDSDYGTRQEQFTLNAAKLVAWAAVAIGALATVAWLSVPQYTQLLATNFFLVPLIVACALCHVLYRQGHATTGFYVFLIAALLASWGTFFLLPEMMLASLVGYTVVVTVSFLLLGDRGGMGMVVVSMLFLAVDVILVEFVTPEWFTPLAETPALIVKMAFPIIAFPVIAGTIRHTVTGQRVYFEQAQRMTARLRETVAVLQERSDELAERTHEMEASLRVTSAASERVSPDELLKLVVNLIRDQFHFYHVQVYTVEETSPPVDGTAQRPEGTEEGIAVLRESTGYAGRRLLQQKHHIPLDRPSLVARAISEGQPVLVRDVSQDPGYLPNPLLPGTRSELVVPLKIGERVIGVLDVQARELDRFTPGLVTLFQTLVGQIVFLLENSELIQRVTEQGTEMVVFTDQLRTAAEIAQRLGAILDPEHLLQEMVSLLQSRFGLYHAHVYVLDEEARTLTLRAGSGEVGRVLVERGHGIPLDREKSLVARAAREGQTVIVADTSLDSDFMPNPLLPQTRSEIAVPLIVGDRALGVLDVQDDRPHRFTPADVDTFGTLAGQIATALQNAGLFAATQARLHVSQALAGAQTEEQVLDAMIQAAYFYPQALVVVFTLDQEADELTAVMRRFDVLESGIMPAGDVGARYTASQFTLFNLISAHTPFVSADFLNDARADPASRALIERLGAASVCVLPITAGDEWLGILVGESRQKGFFDARRIHLYDSLAEQGAVALRTARLSDQVAESLQETQARLRVSQALAGARTEDEVLDAMIRVADFYPQARVTIMTIDQGADELAATLCRAEAFDSGMTEQIPLGTRFTASLMPLFQHISPHTSFISPNISLDERADPQTRQLVSQQGTASFAILPITAGDEWLGIFTASTREENFFDERKLYLYRPLVEQGAIALRTARLSDQVAESLRETQVRLEVSQALAGAETEDEVLDVMIQQAGVYPQARVAIYTFDPEAEERTVISRRDTAFDSGLATLEQGACFPVSRLPLLQYFKPDEIFVMSDVARDELVDPSSRKVLDRFGYSSLAVLPLAAGAQELGLILTTSRQAGYFDERKLHLYQTLADLGAPALQAARLRAEIERSEREYRTVADFTYGWETWTGEGDKYIYVSPACERITGYTVDEFMENPGLFVEIVHPDDRAVVEAHMREYRSVAETEPIEYRIITKDGQERWIGHVCQPVYDAEGNWQGQRGSNREITAEKRAEESLREREGLLQSIVNNTSSVVFVKDLEGRYLLINSQYERLFHVSRQDIVGKTDHDVFPQEAAEAFRKADLEVLKANRLLEVEELVPHDDGMHTYISLKFPLYDAEGKPYAVCGLATDITERVQAEARVLRQSAVLEAINRVFEEALSSESEAEVASACLEMAQELTDSKFGFIGELNPAGRFDTTAISNPGWDSCKVPHSEATVLIQDMELRGIWAGVLRDERPLIVNAPATHPDRVGVPEGHPALTAFMGVPLKREGKTFGMIALANKEGGYDLTDQQNTEALAAAFVQALYRKRAEEALLASEARFRDVALSTSDWVWEVDAQGRYTYVSDRVVEVLGYTVEEMLSKTPFDVMPPEEAAHVGGVFGEIAAHKRPIVEMESWLVAKDGREVCMLTDGVPILDAEGNLMGYRGVDRDITERKQLNEITRGLNAARDEDELLAVLLQLAIKAGADQAYLEFILLDEAGEPEWIEVVANWQKEGQSPYPVGARLYLPEFPYTKLWLYDSEKPLIVANLDTDERISQGERDMFAQINVRALVIVPLTQAGRWVGLLPIFWSEPHAHSETETALYNALPALATPAIASRRLLIEQERALTETLYRISSGLNKASDVGEQLHVLARPAIDAGMSTATLLYIDLDQDNEPEWAEIVAYWQREGAPPLPVRSRFYLPEFLFADLWVASPDKAQLIADVTADERVDENTGNVLAQSGTRALVTVPLLQAGLRREQLRQSSVEPSAERRWVGLVIFGWAEPHEFSGQEAEVYNALIGLASPAVAGRRLMGDLERRVSKRTAQLRTASDIAGQINAILDPDELLSEVVDQLHERFDLYHVHVYLLDEERRDLVIQAGYGEPGRLMLERGHSIPLDREKSLVARAAREREIVLENDTQAAPDFMPNPLLPDTRCEAAVPLIAGGKVLGVFDVQDDQPGRFTSSEVDVFSTLAGHIATALQNAAFVEEIQDIAAQLRQADRLKSDFLSSMSHEIRTPLNSIIGFAEVLLMGISGDLPPAVEEDIQAIFENGQNLLKIINDILDLAKIESGTLALHPEPVEIAPLLEEVKANNAGLLVDKPVEMLLQVEDDLPTLEADPVRIHQVLNNLVSNAVKFTAEGTITLRAFRRDDWLCLEVQDSGVGIGEQDLSRIFDRFEQAGDAVSRARGTGLGLSIVRQLVEMHGGTIEARSALGQGSTFSVYLPITAQ